MTNSLYPRRPLVKDRRTSSKADLSWLDVERPKTRAECEDGIRPCPWAMCKYHLYLDVNPKTGTIRLNHPSKELWELKETCALDMSNDEQTLKTIGKLLNVSRERARQIEVKGVELLRLHPRLRPTLEE